MQRMSLAGFISDWLVYWREMEERTGWEGELFFTVFPFIFFEFSVMYVLK